MSPPKVNLATKDVKEKVPVEKGEHVEFPAVVTVETERRAHHHRRLPHHRRRHVICGILIAIILVGAAISTFALVHKFRRHHHRKHMECRVGDGKLPEHVTVDYEKQLIHAKHEADANNKLPRMHTLHDFGHKMVAYKNEDTNVCFIDRLDETFEEGYARWEGYEKSDRDGKKALKVLTGKPIEAVVLQHVATEHIFLHCKNAKSVWVMEIEKSQITTEMEVVYV